MTPEQERQLMAYLELVMSGGQGSGQMGLDLYPTVDKKVGDTNYYQDRVQMLGDPLPGAMAGPGAFDFDAFMPTIERTPVDSPGRAIAQQWASAPQGSAMRAMYDLITVDQMDVNSAWQEVRKLAEEEPDGIIAQTLPPDKLNTYGEVQPGTGLLSLYEQANEMQAGLATDPAGVMFDPATGGYYTETETPSALAEDFAAMGLPNPIDRYEEASPETAWKHLDREGVGYRGDSPADMGGLAAQSAALNRAMREYSDETRAMERPALADGGVVLPQTSGEDTPGATQYGSGTSRPGTPGMYGTGEVPVEGFPAVQYGSPTSSDIPRGMYSPDGPEPVSKDHWASALFEEGGFFRPTLEDPTPTLPGGVGIARTDGPTPPPGLADSLRGQFSTPQGPGGGVGGIDLGAEWDRYEGDRRKKQREMQGAINQGVRDRRKTRMASDPGSQDAINAYAARGATEAGRTPFMDAMRERMLMQQISGF